MSQTGEYGGIDHDALDREALLAQMGAPGVKPSEVAGGGQQQKPAFDSYTPPAAGDLSNGMGENHSTQTGMLGSTASGALNGASIGSVVPVFGTLAGAGIGAAYGAISGWAKGRNNETSDDREDFAKSLGLKDTTALWDRLKTGTTDQASAELSGRAMNRIGKHDVTANGQWMQDVNAALAAGRPAPAAPATPATSSNLGAPAAGIAVAPGPSAASVARTTPYNAISGWDTARLNDKNDISGKYVMQRWAQDHDYGPGGSKQWGPNAVREFMADPEGGKENWEMRGDANDNDPNIRQKQEYLSSHDPGRITQWQDVIQDSGPGGANGMSFSNADSVGGPDGLPFERMPKPDGLPFERMPSPDGLPFERMPGFDKPSSSVSSDPAFFERLMAQLKGGLADGSTSSVDDNALRNLMERR